MSAYRVITNADAAVGFRLAGIETLVAEGPEAAERIVTEQVNSREVGILLINQQFMDRFSDTFQRKIEKLTLPLIIPIPISSTWWTQEPEQDYVFNLIRRAIGYQMKIKRS